MSKKPDTRRTPIYFFRIREKRTLKAVAEEFGVEPRTLIRWEQGEIMIPLKRLADAEKIYGVNRSEIRPDIFGAAQ